MTWRCRVRAALRLGALRVEVLDERSLVAHQAVPGHAGEGAALLSIFLRCRVVHHQHVVRCEDDLRVGELSGRGVSPVAVVHVRLQAAGVRADLAVPLVQQRQRQMQFQKKRTAGRLSAFFLRFLF